MGRRRPARRRRARHDLAVCRPDRSSAGRWRASPYLAVAVMGIAIVRPIVGPTGIIVTAGVGGWRCAGRTGISTAGRRVAIPVVVLRLRQAVIGLFDADAVPGLGVRRQGESGIAQEPVGHQLGGALPALQVGARPGGCGA